LRMSICVLQFALPSLPSATKIFYKLLGEMSG